MNRLLMNPLVVGLVMFGANEALAGGKSAGGGSRSGKGGWSGSYTSSRTVSSTAPTFKESRSGKFSDYFSHYGTKFSHGYYYKGSHHRHWTSWYWNPSWGCWFYWCPSTCCYYYWYAPTGCFYPASYAEYAPPTCASSTEVAVAPQAVATASATVSIPDNSPPPGETPPPPGSLPVAVSFKKPLSP
jgi:hypothetical protein